MLIEVPSIHSQFDLAHTTLREFYNHYRALPLRVLLGFAFRATLVPNVAIIMSTNSVFMLPLYNRFND
jgi:hypothetical protein